MEKRRRNGFSLSVLMVFIIIAALISGAAVYIWQNPGLLKDESGAKANQPEKSLREAVQSRADEVLHALKNKDLAKLTQYVHPEKGLKFSPYSYVTDKAVSMTAAELPNAFSDNSKRKWGDYDGSGDPINLTFNEYYNKFVYEKNYLEAPEIIFNQALSRGNSQNNIKEAFPGSTCIEYYFSGFDKQYEGMDWRSLTLVFEQKDGIWYLVGVVNNQWTI